MHSTNLHFHDDHILRIELEALRNFAPRKSARGVRDLRKKLSAAIAQLLHVFL